MLDGAQGPGRAERGWRCRKAPPFWAAALSLTKPERIMAWVMGLTVCWLVEAARASRRRLALTEPGATLPAHQGQRTQRPPARGGFPDCVGRQGRSIPGPGRLRLKLTDAPQPLLPRLGQRSAWCDR